MALERTFSIIKPDATERNITGKINAMIEGAGLRIIAQKRIHMTEDQAKGFYAVHAERPFYNDLVAFMTSGPAARPPVSCGAHAAGRERPGSRAGQDTRPARSRYARAA